ncbi:MAG TPA: hypothetical protein PLA50_12480 [Bacteroidia bacterium]|nr:hypothetical protein [Bacteroidia bacterium]
MFKRILHEDWATLIQIGSFLTLFAVFLVSTIRAVRLRPEERERLAALPLDTPGNDR